MVATRLDFHHYLRRSGRESSIFAPRGEYTHVYAQLYMSTRILINTNAVYHPYAALVIEIGTVLFYFARFAALVAYMSRLSWCQGSVCGSARADIAFDVFEWMLWMTWSTLAGQELSKQRKPGFCRANAETRESGPFRRTSHEGSAGALTNRRVSPSPAPITSTFHVPFLAAVEGYAVATRNGRRGRSRSPVHGFFLAKSWTMRTVLDDTGPRLCLDGAKAKAYKSDSDPKHSPLG
ncbi:hypothetical protein F5Y17DRAFT_160650 [Xylariaceae sp. FL0594]|nr:hypothetical protein F5Y17DRAFT_160650 [Xylariaceae sp. FL0594]